MLYINQYECPSCGYYWEDVWDSIVLDECPYCGMRHIEPFESEYVEEVVDTDSV